MARSFATSSVIVALVACASGKQAVAPPAGVDRSKVLEHLREPWSEEWPAFLDELAQEPSSPEVVPELVEVLREHRSAKSEADTCTLLRKIAKRHPQTALPLEPLLETIDRHAQWTSQVRCLETLFVALESAKWKGLEPALVKTLVSTLVSQRGPVLEQAVRCLHRISDLSFGPDPDVWAAYYRQMTDKEIDLFSAIFERVFVLTVHGPRSNRSYSLDGRPMGAITNVRDEILAHKKILSARPPLLEVVIHVPDDALRANRSDLWQEAWDVLLEANLGVAVLPESAPIRPVYHELDDDFVPEGTYAPAEPPPGELGGIEQLELVTSETDLGTQLRKRAPTTGALLAGEHTYEFVRANLRNSALSFLTHEIEGVQYAFVGQFLKRGNFPDRTPVGTVLTGRLRKLHNGRPTAHGDLSFVYQSQPDR